jgi:acetoacetyl-CoA synthetase
MNLPVSAPPLSNHTPQIRLYQTWLAQHRGLAFERYDDVWRWSTTDLDAFWQSIWDYFDVQSPTPHTAVLARNAMPGAQWFPGAQVNYARQVLRHVQPAHAAGFPAVVARNERGDAVELSWPELRRQVAALALHLRAQGVQRGDRVAAYLPNVPETLVAFLATVSIGAVWSVCAPDMGTPAVLDRFQQIEPTVLIACDGVRYGGRDLDRCAAVNQLRAALPSVKHMLVLEVLGCANLIAADALFKSATSQNDAQTEAFEPDWLAFDHPLWIVYSSGTTGLPKPIVHGHGGTVIVALALKCLHNDVGCSYHPNTWGERFFWYSTTGWVMWNAQMSGLLSGTTCCLFDGSPGGSRDHPDWGTLWRFAADVGATFFGAGAAFYANCLKADVQLAQCGDLSRIRALGTTGSPLSADAQIWGTQQMAAAGVPDIWWCNISGGTDFAGAFIGGNRELPQVPGEMQCRLLGCAVQAWSEQGEPVLGDVGELVCTQPIPSMPLYFWGDASGQRYLASYFDMYPAGHGRRPGGGQADPGAGAVWRHGDWLRIDAVSGACVIMGRSDATINRHGLRMGTSDIYAAVEALPEVLDSLVVDLEVLGQPSYMPLFVALREGVVLDAGLRQRLNAAIRERLSPRFVPDDIVVVADIPRTLTGKKQELPIKKLLLGQPLAKVVNRDAMANPECLAWYQAFAEQRLGRLAAVPSPHANLHLKHE